MESTGAGGFSHELLDQGQPPFVDERGRVDCAGLQAEPGALEGCYALIATHFLLN